MAGKFPYAIDFYGTVYKQRIKILIALFLARNNSIKI